VNDKNFMGYDSSISENLIIMDDDCFIGKPLKKVIFFMLNGKVVPLIVANNFKEET